MTETIHKSKKERNEQPPSNLQPRPPQRDSHEETVRERLQALRFLLGNGLTRVEHVVQRSCLSTTNGPAQKLELDGNRDYFIQKLTNIRLSLQLMAEQLDLPASFPESKQVLQLELVALMVLVEGSRASHLVTGDGDFDQKVRNVLNETIENIALDLLNLRARVK